MKTDLTIDPARVHKLSASEVFVAGVETEDELSPSVTVSVPGSHHRVQGHKRLPFVVLIEALRQAGMAYNTLERDPTSRVYILDRIAVTLMGNRPLLDHAGWRQRVMLHTEYLPGGHSRTHMTIPNVCTSTFDYRRTDPRVYARIRGNQHAVQMTSRHDPLLIHSHGPDGQPTLELGWDTNDTMIFDHPVDHVPAMVLIDAALAEYAVSVGGPPHSIDALFLGFLTMTYPVSITSDAGRVLFSQNDQVGARVNVH